MTKGFLEDAVGALQSRMLKKNNSIDSPKGNKGVRLLLESGVQWRERMSDWLTSAEEDIRLRYMSACKNGLQVKLTAVSINIGEDIAYEAGLDDSDPFITLPIGDLILGALVDAEIIKVEPARQADGTVVYHIIYNGRVYDKAVMKATYTTPPGDIKSLRSKAGKPLIKGWRGLDYRERFEKLIEMNPVFIQSLNQMRNTGWVLNQTVLNILKQNKDRFFKPTITLIVKGKEIEFDINSNPDLYKSGPRNRTYWADDLEREFEGKQDIRLQQIKSKNYEYMTIMQKTQHESVQDVFYQEYNCDWRGRVYCMESFLQFQGTDMARGLFLFAEKKKYNEGGVRALKIHIANSYNVSLHKDKFPNYFTEDYLSMLEEEGLEEISLDKLSLDDRVLWVEKNWFWLETATDCLLLDKPREAENPVALLAAIIELKNVLADPDYEGGLPIPLDGANNGWQHLSAMSKDRQSAELVSCTNVRLQKDFYVAVAKEMIRQYPGWFKKKNMKMKEIRKGIAKRGAMTRAYSAGTAAIALNMWNDVRQQKLDLKYGITENDCNELAKVLITSVNVVCSGPLRLTKWLQELVDHEVSEAIKQKEDSAGLFWATPSGFPVVYNTYQQCSVKIRSFVSSYRINHSLMINQYVSEKEETIDPETGEIKEVWKKTDRLKPNRRNYAKGIAPNVVHSFDAAHLALTMSRFDGTMAVVHDSFATHGCDIAKMLDATKETFIEMYDTPNWFADFKQRAMRFADTFTVSDPVLGDYRVEEVRDSRYFFC